MQSSGGNKYDFNDKILLLEDYANKNLPLSIIGKLYELKQDGVFDKINAIWIGNYNNTDTFNLEEEILKLTKEASFPLLSPTILGI